MKTRLALTLVALFFAALSWFSIVDHDGEQYLDDSLKQAAAVFGTIRLLNGVVSVAQGTEVGVGFGIAVGEILDPLNDLLERFSWVMLASITSLGIQKLLLAFGSAQGISLVLSVFSIIFIVMLWRPKWRHSKVLVAVTRLMLAMLVLRYAVVIAILLNQFVYQQFMESDYVSARDGLEQTSLQVSNESRGMGQKQNESGTFSGLWEQLSDSGRYVKLLLESASGMVGYILDLIVVFLVQTVLVPLLFLWVIVRLLGWVAKSDGPLAVTRIRDAGPVKTEVVLAARRDSILPLQ